MKVSYEKTMWLLHLPILSSPHPSPVQSLSISVVRCHRFTMCLLCVTLFSSRTHTPCVLNIIPLSPLLPPSPPVPPYSSPLVTTSSFLESLSLLLFCSFSFASLLYSTNKGNHLALVFLCLAYFTEHNVLQLHPCCCKW